MATSPCIANATIERADCETEITPRMIEAGTEVIREMIVESAVGPLFSSAELASEVFLAMSSRRKRERSQLE